LYVPARPRVPQIVPPEVFYAGPLQGRIPGFGPDLSNRFPFVAEHVCRMLPGLASDDHHGLRVERDRDGLPCFRLIGMNPGGARAAKS
jgi:hypothetical protein